MNREIKFRAWNEPLQEMDYTPRTVFSGENKLNSIADHLRYGNELGLTYVQYTGLKDKNGVEIYEGDIVRTSGGNAEKVIKWNYAGFNLAKRYNGDGVEQFEVIGNIYENGDLL